MLRVLYYHVVQSLRDGVTLVGRGCVMYALSIVTKSHAELNYLLGGSEPSRWVHPLGSSLRFGVTHLIGTKA